MLKIYFFFYAGSNVVISDMTSKLRKRKKPAIETNKNSKVVHSKSKPKRSMSLRKFFGKNESVYIMDGKTCSNICRYINHSCSPNVFVQNVFVDTHDLRFPWISLFALKYIEAGTEISWDYGYEIGSVPGRTLECCCGSAICRKRLL